MRCLPVLLYCTVLYCIVLYCMVLLWNVLHCTSLYCTVLYFSTTYSIVSYCITHNEVSLPPCTAIELLELITGRTTRRCTAVIITLHYTTLYYTTHHYTTLHYTTLHKITLEHNIDNYPSQNTTHCSKPYYPTLYTVSHPKLHYTTFYQRAQDYSTAASPRVE